MKFLKAMAGYIYDFFMWIVLALTIFVMVVVTWPIYLVSNFVTIIKTEIMFSMASFFLALDQLSKYLVVKTMLVGQSIPVINEVFHITYVQNQGAAFGLFQKKWYLFITVAALSITVIIYYSKFLAPNNLWVQISLALLLAGALGNLIDRVKYKYVIDFMDVRFWPVFNIADIVINIGVGMLIVEMIWEPHDEHAHESSEN